MESIREAITGAVSAVLGALPWPIRCWLWTILTHLVIEREDGSAPEYLNLEGRKLLGVCRWYMDAMEPPRPSWAHLERWANLDDPDTAAMRAEEVRRTARRPDLEVVEGDAEP